MTEQTKPKFEDIENLVNEIPIYPSFTFEDKSTTQYLSQWLSCYSKTLDLSKGLNVNRCALYWSAYNQNDAFDGTQFVQSCQNSNGSLNRLATFLDTDLQIFELDPHNNHSSTLDDLVLATSYGMMAVEESTQLFCACHFGAGVEKISQEVWQTLKTQDKPFNLLAFYQNDLGTGHAALLGATIASLLKGIPVILEGYSGLIIKEILEQTTKNCFDVIITTQTLETNNYSSLPGHKMISTAILLKTLWLNQIETELSSIKTAA